MISLLEASVTREGQYCETRPQGQARSGGVCVLHFNIKADVQFLHRINEERAHVFRIAFELRVAQARNDFVEHHVQFQSRQVGADAEVLADAERAQLVIKVWHSLGTGDVESHGVIAEGFFIVIGGVVVQ